MASFKEAKSRILREYVDKYGLIRGGNVDTYEANATHITGLFYLICKMNDSIDEEDKNRFKRSIEACFKTQGLLNRHPDFPKVARDGIDSHDNFKMVLCGAYATDNLYIAKEMLIYGDNHVYNYNNLEVPTIYTESDNRYYRYMNLINSMVRPLNRVSRHVKPFWCVSAQRGPAEIGFLKKVCGVFDVSASLAISTMVWSLGRVSYDNISPPILHWAQLAVLKDKNWFYKKLYERFISRWDMVRIFEGYFKDHPIVDMMRVLREKGSV